MNTQIISFPGLGIEINPPKGFDIGPLHVQFYGLIIACGLLLAAWYALRRRKEFGLKEDDLLDGILWIVPFAVLCARLYYCAFEWDRYADNPIEILYIWQGGLAIYGGVIGAVIGIFVYCRIKKLSPFALLDIVGIGFLIGQCLGRWGNFFNREAHGGETDSFLRMGLLDPLTGEGKFYHPTFLYESLWNAAGFVLLHFLSKKRRYDGQIALGYVAWYGLGRAIIEGMRTDSLWWGPFRVSQVLAAVSCIAALGVLVWQQLRPHDPKDMFVNRRAAMEAAEAVPVQVEIPAEQSGENEE